MMLQLFDAPSSTYTYIVIDDVSREAAVIDPVLEHADRDLSELARHGLNLRWVLDTHLHADHETGANALKMATGATSAVGVSCGSVGHDRALQDGDVLALGDGAIRVIATPGHTPGSVSYLWSGNVFTGDALLIEGCGRTDFQNGSSDELYDSITGKLFALPDDTNVWPAHDYRFRASSTIGHEKRHNPRLAGKDRDTFRQTMAGLNLAPPRQLDQVVPANRHGGALQSGEPALPMLMAHDLAREFDPSTDALADLRDEADFYADALPDAVRVDHNHVETLAAIADNHRKLFLICRTGRRTLAATETLLKAGHNNVWNITGGMLALRGNAAITQEANDHA